MKTETETSWLFDYYVEEYKSAFIIGNAGNVDLEDEMERLDNLKDLISDIVRDFGNHGLTDIVAIAMSRANS